MSDVILVLGMHRSGTSGVAGVLTKLGVAAPKTMMPPAAENTRGYFESLRFMELHDEILASAGSTWQDWRQFNPEWHKSAPARSFQQRAKQLFEAEFDDAPLAVLKDPRVCRFAPFWLGVLADMNATPHIVMPVRSPLDVALSLKQARGLSIAHGLLLWLRHVLDAEAHTRTQLRSIFSWTEFVSDWKKVSKKISNETALAWPRLSDRSAHEIAQFLSNELVHNETSHAELIGHSDVHEWTVRAYDALLELETNPFSNSAYDTLDQIRDLFEQASKIFGSALLDYEVRLETSEKEKRDSLAASEVKLQATHREFDITRGLLDGTKQAFQRAEERVALLSSELAVFKEQDRSASAAAEEMREMQQQLAANKQELAAMQQALEAGIDEKNRIERTAQSEVVSLKQDLSNALSAKEEAMRASFAIDELEMRFQKSESEVLLLRRQLATMESEKQIAISTGRDQLSAMQRRLTATDQELLDTQTSLKAAIAAERAFEEEVLIAKAKLVNTHVALNKISLDDEKKQETISLEPVSIRRTLEAIEIISTAYIETETKLHDHQTNLALLRRQIETSEKVSASRSEKNTQLEEKIAVLHLDLERHRDAAATLESHVETINAELIAARESIEAHTSTIHKYDEVSARLQKQSRALGIKRGIEKELEAASNAIRPQVGAIPYGFAFYGSQLRSPFLSITDVKRKLRSERRELERWGHFDAAYYLAQNPDIQAAKIDAFTHFLRHGILEDRDPNPLFNSGWYRAAAGAQLGKMPPFLHYLRHGQGSKLSPHPLFDSAYYLDKNGDVAQNGIDPFVHFRNHGAVERRDPHPLVWMKRLADQKGFEDSSNCLLDYLTKPDLFKASPHPLFDGEAYLSNNKDVAQAGINPLLHYCTIGWHEGRQPHKLFAGDWYLANNPDVVAAGLNPLYHYIRHGWLEHRAPHPLFDIRYYYGRYRDVRKMHFDPLSHYILNGAHEGRQTSDKISLDLIREVVPPTQLESQGPLAAFLQFEESDLSFSNLAAETKTFNGFNWPPSPDPIYWLPQKLRNHILERYGEEPIRLYTYLMSVVERYGDQAKAFSESSDFNLLVKRLQKLALKHHHFSNTLDISIIIPVYNNIVFTLTCVLSVLENASRFSYEILIGDDLSSDATEQIFKTLPGPVRYVRHARNLGFLENCNACVEGAKGRNIVFLNNDTLTLPGWLDELIDPLESSADVGLVGSKLLSGDGSLQEAGGIFWRDGSAWNFGRGDNPALPQYNYRKEADYISGASIALAVTLWRQLGGFDSNFAPAYCEDADLAFRVREAGLRTVYAPHSELVHHEGKSHGSETSSGIKAYQVINMKKLYARWRNVLESEHFDNGESVFFARDRSRSKPHLLYIDHYIPQWDRDAGSRATLHVLRMFVEAGFHVTFWPDNLHEDRDYCRTLQKMGIEVIYSGAYVDQFETWFGANGCYFDYALVSRPHIAIKYYQTLRTSSQCKILYYGHDIHYRRMEMEKSAKDTHDLSEAIEIVRKQELSNWVQSDIVLYFSAEERDVVRKTDVGCRAEQVPLLGFLPEEIAQARENLRSFAKRNFYELLFVGGAHPPNIDALNWFVQEILPLILSTSPQTRLHIVGAAAFSEIAHFDSGALILHGNLSDDELAALYAEIGIVVIPLRFGGGVKGKMIEALFHAAPIVTTPIGMQGLDPNSPLAFVAASCDAFAEAILEIQKSPSEAKRQVESGLAFIENDYSIAALRRGFAAVIPECESKSGLE